MAVSEQQLMRRLNSIEAILRMMLNAQIGPPVVPEGLGDREELEVKSGFELQKENAMAHYIKNRQHMQPVPMGKDIVRQSLVVLEDGTEIFRDDDVAFDAATGEETPPLPEFWAEVGKNIDRQITYYRADGSASTPGSFPYVQEDQFTAPLPAPADAGATEQIDEQESDTRPTT